MREIAHLVALYEMREEQLQLHLSLVRAGSVEAENSIGNRNDANAEKSARRVHR